MPESFCSHKWHGVEATVTESGGWIVLEQCHHCLDYRNNHIRPDAPEDPINSPGGADQ